MINSKMGQKTWSDNPQNTVKPSGVNNLSAGELKSMGEESVGDMLNKVADSNWVDPSKKPRGVGNNKLDKDAFMKLMFAQMKNQDPTNPVQSHEMAAQLAQFSQLEQLQNVNTTLNEMQKGQKPTEQFQTLNFIGKSVSGDSSKITRLKGDKEHEFNYTLPEAATSVKIVVKNAEGEPVRKIDLKNVKKGEQSFTWNGIDDKGNTVPTGEYKIESEATTAQGTKLAVRTQFDGVITGVNYTPEGPVLMVGNQTVKLKDVKKIVDPVTTAQAEMAKMQMAAVRNLTGSANDQNSQDVNKQDLKNKPQVRETKNNTPAQEGAQEPERKGNIADSVSMTGGMMNRLEKELSAKSTTEVPGAEKNAEAAKPEATR